MSDVNLQLVRECFELNLFRVLTNWQQADTPLQAGEHAGQLFVENTYSAPVRDLPFLLHPVDLPAIERAVIEIRAWHRDRVYPSVIESKPVLTQFVSEESLTLARNVFDNQPFRTILVLSELPASADLRARSLAILQETGIDHVMEFPSLLQELIAKVNINSPYPASQTLQTLRLLKLYKLVRNQQMEFPFAAEAPVTQQHVDTAEPVATDPYEE